jgi:hypothetical protein
VGGPVLVVETLRSLGYLEATIRRIVEVARDLRALQEADGVEYAAMLDAASGEHVSPVIRGEPTKVDTSPHIDALRTGHTYVQVHTHPSARTFSLFDVRVLCDAPAVRASAVVASGDWWYVMTVQPGEYPAPFRKVYEEYVRERGALQATYQGHIDDGRMTEDQAIAALDREVWGNIAPRLRLHYHQFRTQES